MGSPNSTGSTPKRMIFFVSYFSLMESRCSLLDWVDFITIELDSFNLHALKMPESSSSVAEEVLLLNTITTALIFFLLGGSI